MPLLVFVWTFEDAFGVFVLSLMTLASIVWAIAVGYYAVKKRVRRYWNGS